MLQAYLDFSRQNWRPLLFGALLLALSSFGQTYFVAVSGSFFRGAFHLSDGGLGTAYAVGTLLSALTLGWAGRLIDYTTVRRFTWCVALLLAGACLLASASLNAVMLTVAFYGLRLGGQGLMTHTAYTATARAFPKDAGKAVGVVSLGICIAQAVLPILAVLLMERLGWRIAWALNAAFVLAGVTLALRFLPRAGDLPLRRRQAGGEAGAARPPPLWRDRRLWLACPALLANPFIITGFFFHQARLAEQKGWDLTLVAASFAAFALVQAVAALAIGPVIDRLGPARVLSSFLIPQALGLVLLSVGTAPWVALAYMVLMAVSAAIGSTLSTALWVDLFGPADLARVRSVASAGAVVASGASPVLMGLLIDAGIPLAWQAVGCCVYTLLVSVVALGLRREGRAGRGEA